MSHQQLVDGGLVLLGVGLMAVFGILESAFKGWLQSRRDRTYLRALRKGIR